MKCRTVFGAVLLASASLGSAQSNLSKPSSLDVLYSAFPSIQGPIWVSARELSREPGRIAWEKLQPLGRELVSKSIERQDQELRKRLANGEKTSLPNSYAPKIAGETCLETTLQAAPYSGESAPTTFAGLVAEAGGILEGQIQAIEPGFLQGLPASLLEVRVKTLYRSSRETAKSDRYYVFYPMARFALGGHTFCNAAGLQAGKSTQPSPYFEPEIGGRVLLFVFGRPLDRGGVLLTPLPEQIIYESPRGELQLPDALRRDDELHPARNLDQVEEILGSALGDRSSPDKPGRPADGVRRSGGFRP